MTEAQGLQLLTQTRLESGPGPEQTETGLHLQQQGAGVMQADLGTEAIGPGGEQLLLLLDGVGVVFGRGESLGQGLGAGQALPGTQTKGAGGRIDRLQNPAIARTAKQHQRLIGVVTTAQDAVERQLR